MAVPQVLSVREFRADLAHTFEEVKDPNHDPVFVGAHRKPEVVVMSVAQYEKMAAAARRQAADEALATVQAEGLEPSTAAHELMDQVVAGDMDAEEAKRRLLERYRR